MTPNPRSTPSWHSKLKKETTKPANERPVLMGFWKFNRDNDLLNFFHECENLLKG
jgi:hypothetical protein